MVSADGGGAWLCDGLLFSHKRAGSKYRFQRFFVPDGSDESVIVEDARFFSPDVLNVHISGLGWGAVQSVQSDKDDAFSTDVKTFRNFMGKVDFLLIIRRF